MTNSASIEQQLLAATRQISLLLMQVQNNQLMNNSVLDPKELKILLRKQEFERRAMLPEDSRPPWVCGHEACWLCGLDLFPSDSHIRRIMWAHTNGYLVTTNGGTKNLNFLRTEVMALNQLIIAGEVIIPKKFS